jgi:hypothetical protein
MLIFSCHPALTYNRPDILTRAAFPPDIPYPEDVPDPDIPPVIRHFLQRNRAFFDRMKIL